MKSITLITYNRPHYLAEALKALKANNLEGYTLYVGCEPGCRAVINMVKKIDFMPVKWWVNTNRMGIDRNAFNTLSTAFEDHSEINLHLEDDIVVSPDAMDLVNWYHDLRDKHNHLGVALNGPWSNPAWPNVVQSVVPTMTALGAGFICTSWQWSQTWRRQWFAGYAPAWDKTIEMYAQMTGLTLLRPLLVRSTSIGKWGMSHQGVNNEFFELNPISTQKGTQFMWRD